MKKINSDIREDIILTFTDGTQKKYNNIPHSDFFSFEGALVFIFGNTAYYHPICNIKEAKFTTLSKE